MGLEANQPFDVPEGNLNKLIGSWPSPPGHIRRDSRHHVGHALPSGGLRAAQSPRWFLCVCTGVSDGVSECVTVPSSCFTPSGVVPLLAGEGRGVAKGGDPLKGESSWPQRPFMCSQNHFIFLTRNNTQSNGFQLPLLLFLTAGQGEEGAPARSLPLLGPPDPSSVERMLCAPCHVRARGCTCSSSTWAFRRIGRQKA